MGSFFRAHGLLRQSGAGIRCCPRLIGSLTRPAERVEKRVMSTDEQERTLGQTVLRLRAKQTEHRCIQSKANDLTRILEEVIRLHKDNQHGDKLSLAIQTLQDSG